ncbi:Glycosyl transferase family 2 [Micrococcales bacterium KH10]|nr:Glycosyl transferase family 2 [Micrococcales bacterium KH10]
MTRTSTPLIRRVRAVFQRVRSAVGRRLLGPAGQLLVIVPVYNVAGYLAECFESLSKQTFTDFVVIAVNDGSTDNSLETLQAAARVDRRIRIISQRNAGLGAARNAGLRHWRLLRWRRPPYVTFLDPDDILPADAFARYFSAVRQSGSVLCVGGIDRFIDDVSEKWRPYWAKQAHRTALTAQTVEQQPQVLRDIVACNRMIRRDFWDEVNGLFPVNVRYEDHLPVLRLYLHAPAFDLLKETTYLWRQREDGSSIAQQKHSVSHLRDWIAAHRQGMDEVRNATTAEVMDAYVARILDVGLPGFVKKSPYAAPEYQDEVAHFAGQLIGYAVQHPQVWQHVVAHRGALASLAAQHAYEDIKTISETLDEAGSAILPVINDGGELVLDPTLTTAAIPRYARTLAPAQYRLGVQVIAAEPGHIDVTVAFLGGDAGTLESCTAELVSIKDEEDRIALVANRLDDGQWRVLVPNVNGAGSDAYRLEVTGLVRGITVPTRRLSIAGDPGDKISEALGQFGWQWNRRNGQLRWQPPAHHS